MRKQRTHYDKSFKENAVKLSLERKNVTELALELGIDANSIWKWFFVNFGEFIPCMKG